MTNRQSTANSASRNFSSGARAVLLNAVSIATMASALMLIALAAEAGSYPAGAVRDQTGRPVAGAIVTLTDRQLRRATSVYTASDGHFNLPNLAASQYDLRVRRAGYADLTQNGIALTGYQGEMQLTMNLEDDPNELAWQLPANRWTPLESQGRSAGGGHPQCEVDPQAH